MFKKNFIKEKLSSGKSVIGIWSIINSPIVADIAAHAGLDFQIFDMEHGVFDLTMLDNCVRACESMECSPLVRVPGLHRTTIQNCLDLGAHGIIVPQVKNYHEVLDVIQASKFSPTGSRGFNPFTRAACYNPSLPLASTKLNNDFGLTSVIVENKTVYADIEKILAIPDLDMLYLGIYDLSFDLGLGGNINHPDVLEFTTSVIKKIKHFGKIAGVMVKDETEMKKYIELGANFIVYGVDTYTYYSAIEKKVSEFRKQVSTTFST